MAIQPYMEWTPIKKNLQWKIGYYFKKISQQPMTEVYKEFIHLKAADVRRITVLLKVILAITGSTALCECGFCEWVGKKFLQTRLSEKALDHIMHIIFMVYC